MDYVIDRIEGNRAVLAGEGGFGFEVPLRALPKGAAEGQVVTVSIDKKKSDSRKSDMQQLVDRLWAD